MDRIIHYHLTLSYKACDRVNPLELNAPRNALQASGRSYKRMVLLQFSQGGEASTDEENEKDISDLFGDLEVAVDEPSRPSGTFDSGSATHPGHLSSSDILTNEEREQKEEDGRETNSRPAKARRDFGDVSYFRDHALSALKAKAKIKKDPDPGRN